MPNITNTLKYHWKCHKVEKMGFFQEKWGYCAWLEEIQMVPQIFPRQLEPKLHVREQSARWWCGGGLSRACLDVHTSGFRNYLANLSQLKIKKHLQFDKPLLWGSMKILHSLPSLKFTPSPRPQTDIKSQRGPCELRSQEEWVQLPRDL